jgi:hypothetical protein
MVRTWQRVDAELMDDGNTRANKRVAWCVIAMVGYSG